MSGKYFLFCLKTFLFHLLNSVVKNRLCVINYIQNIPIYIFAYYGFSNFFESKKLVKLSKIKDHRCGDAL